MDEDQTKGVTFSEIVRIVLKKIWIVLLASVLTAAVAALVVGLAINPMRTSYSMDFQLVFPKSETEKYPDGSPFYYYNIVSSDFLNEAKNSDAAFSSVDIDKMIKKEAVGISVKQEQNQAPVYTLTVKGSYFSSQEVAEKFLRSAAGVASSRIRKNASGVDFGLKQEVFENASYGKKLQLLTEWKTTMKSAYEEWIGEYSATYTVNGKTLQNYLSVLDTVYDEDTQKGLTEALKTFGYEQLDISSYETLKAAIDARRSVLEEEFRTNQLIIDQLETYLKSIQEGGESGGTQTNAAQQFAAAPKADENDTGSTTITIEANDVMSISQMIAFYTRRNTLIKEQITPALDESNIQKFVNRIEAQYEDLSGAATTLAGVTASVYERETDTYFTSQRAQVNSHLSSVLMAVAAFVAAFLIASAVVYFVCRPKQIAAEGQAEPVQAQTIADGDESK